MLLVLTINTSTSFVEWMITSPQSNVSNFDPPPFNRFRAPVFKGAMTIFHFVCQGEIHIAMEKRFQFHFPFNTQRLIDGCTVANAILVECVTVLVSVLVSV